MNTTTRANFAKYNMKAIIVAAVIAAFIGVFIGMAASANAADTAAETKVVATPVPTVTVTAAPVVAVVPSPEPVKIKKVRVVTVPESCLTALNTADRGFTLSADLTSEFQDVITGIQNQDINAVKSAISNVKSINSSLTRLSPKYNDSKALCRSAAE